MKSHLSLATKTLTVTGTQAAKIFISIPGTISRLFFAFSGIKLISIIYVYISTSKYFIKTAPAITQRRINVFKEISKNLLI